MLRSLGLLGLVLLSASLSCAPPVPMNKPGNLFIRQQICDLEDFKKAFLVPSKLKAEGFEAYSLHRDLKDPKTYILTLKCSNLRKAVSYIQTSDFHVTCVGAGLGIPVIWAGLDIRERTYENNPHMKGGIVIAHNEVKDYPFWQKCFDAEGGHHHANRGYTPSNYSIHYMPGNPEVAIVVHEASDVTKAPAFMTSPAMRGVMDSTGVTAIDIWYGTNLEEGLF